MFSNRLRSCATSPLARSAGCELELGVLGVGDCGPSKAPGVRWEASIVNGPSG